MECTWHVLVCVLVELLPPVELWPCWEERGNLAAVAWPTVSWKNERETKGCFFFSFTWLITHSNISVTAAKQTVWYLRNRMMPFNYHRTHGWSHTHHLEVAACSLTNVSTCSDASRYSLWRFLLTGCDNTTTDLKQQTLLIITLFFFFFTKLESFCVLGQQFDNHVFHYIITITVTHSCCESGHCHYMEAPCIRVNRLSCRMLTCLWELAVPPSGSELCTTVVGGSTSALDTGAPELTWGKGNQEHIWKTDPMKDLRRNRTMTQKNHGV